MQLRWDPVGPRIDVCSRFTPPIQVFFSVGGRRRDLRGASVPFDICRYDDEPRAGPLLMQGIPPLFIFGRTPASVVYPVRIQQHKWYVVQTIAVPSACGRQVFISM